jgi:lambda family phage portal protein
VEIDANGAAIAYHFRQGHPGDAFTRPDALRWVRVRREQAWGRPVVLHHFDKMRDGQTRGVSRLAPIIEKLRMEDHYGRVELQAAVINAVLAAFIKSPMDPEAISDMLTEDTTGWNAYNTDRAEYHSERGEIRMAGAKIPHLYPGEDIGTVPSARPAAQFGDFEAAVLRHIAAGMRQSYEQLSKDWSQTNYSSARAALIEVWRGWHANRGAFGQGFCQPYFMAWLEEKWDEGLLPRPANAPDFHENWGSYARTKWVGPGKGFVDPVKEVQASALRVALGLSTLEDEAAELSGTDLDQNLAQIRREIARMPEGTLHPMQESFAKLLGPGPVQGERERAREELG